MHLSKQTIDTIKATVPVLQEHGMAITSRMYEVLFDKYPETTPLFKSAPEDQPRILAAAVAAYAANIGNLDVLKDAVERMAVAHVRTHVRPEHYPMVGDAILTAMQDVLGEAATPQILEAWKEAYFFLADILINREEMLYATRKTG